MSIENPKRVLEDITVPGMIVSNAGMAKDSDVKVRFTLFTIGAGGEGDSDDSLHLEALLNREDVIILDYHKYTFQHTFHIAITYSEPTGKKKDDSKTSQMEKDLNQAV